MKTTIISVLALAAIAGTASAQVYNGPGFAISDNNSNSSTLVAGAPSSITTVTVSIMGLTHTWFADLNAFLTAPNGDVITLFDNVNSSGDPNGTYTFSDSAAAVVAPGDLSGGTFLAQGGSMNALFGGDDAAGIWTLNVNDEAGADVGSIQGWELRLTGVPTPGALALLGMGGLLVSRRRR